MKLILRLAFLFVLGTSIAQTNLLDTSSWTVGGGSVSGFALYGTNQENIRELGNDPYGNQSILWKGTPDGSTDTSEGGWYTDYLAIDHTKTYRFTVWARKSNSFDGFVVFKTYVYDANYAHSGLKLDGTVSTNPTFAASDVPQLDKWYLYVGFIHGSGYTGTIGIGGIYDPVTGTKVLAGTDFKFANTAVTMRNNTILYGSGNQLDSVYFYAPTVYEVNGQEPTITELINGPNGSDTQAPTAPTLSSTGQTDTNADLSWTGAMDDTAVTGYKIFKDGILENTLGTVSTYQVVGLTASTSYSFTATAFDAAGNESGASNAVSITTDTPGGGSSGDTVWNTSGSDIDYTAGNVGIGTVAQTSYRLAVDGKIHTKEVKVDLTGWADYVFTKEYELPTLEEVQKHISEKGHLPNVPSAKEVQANGIELGEMNKLLLEKIEELTLYVIELNNEIETLKKN